MNKSVVFLHSSNGTLECCAIAIIVSAPFEYYKIAFSSFMWKCENHATSSALKIVLQFSSRKVSRFSIFQTCPATLLDIFSQSLLIYQYIRIFVRSRFNIIIDRSHTYAWNQNLLIRNIVNKIWDFTCLKDCDSVSRCTSIKVTTLLHTENPLWIFKQ